MQFTDVMKGVGAGAGLGLGVDLSSAVNSVKAKIMASE
jgi:hypothetical protein